VRHVAVQFEVVASREVLRCLADAQPHLAAHHSRLQGKRAGEPVWPDYESNYQMLLDCLMTKS
jgi:hypothetical protein